LIVDEALSVGDTYFQHKSFERIREFQRLGTTLLIVSHDKAAIQAICDRAILLDAGRLAMEGEPEAVMDYFNAMLSAPRAHEVSQMVLESGAVQTISGTGEVIVEQVALLDERGAPLEVVAVGQAVSLRLRAVCREAVPALVMGFGIKDRLGQPVYGTNTFHLAYPIRDVVPGQTIEVSFEFGANIGAGHYSISVSLHGEGATHVEQNYQWRDRALMFNVINSRTSEFAGVAWLNATVRGVA
jgi:lipopolysaccharide transport system ATP-binding protein